MNKNMALKTEKSERHSFFDLANSILESLSERPREIIKKRFGLLGEKEIKTLDSIGKEYKITRERVRQIIADSFRKISKDEKAIEKFAKAENKIILEISGRSGIIKQNEVLMKLSGGDEKERNAAVFFAGCIKNIKTLESKGLIKKAWAVSEDILEKIKEIDQIARQVLEGKKVPIGKKELIEEIFKKISSADKREIEDFLEVLLIVSQNKFGKWGLSFWAEINPKSAKDKIYLILKEIGKPLHFSQIAKKIDEHGLSKKKAHPQTIHNELIKDDRFVLIGRGIYALAEWGYSKGTVREVLEKILTEKGTLTKGEILQEILKIRKVKETTVMINLNNSKFFVKESGLYKIKK
jgi:DNA-directed RNA polymerase delta subunit